MKILEILDYIQHGGKFYIYDNTENAVHEIKLLYMTAEITSEPSARWNARMAYQMAGRDKDASVSLLYTNDHINVYTSPVSCVLKTDKDTIEFYEIGDYISGLIDKYGISHSGLQELYGYAWQNNRIVRRNIGMRIDILNDTYEVNLPDGVYLTEDECIYKEIKIYEF